jgi:hypothetical protein
MILIAIGVPFWSAGSAGAASSTRLVWGVKTDGSVSRYLGSGKWETVPGSLAQIDVGAGRVWGVNAAGNVYRYQGSGQWDVLGQGFQSVSVGIASSGERVVWAVRSEGSVSRYLGGGKWEPVPGSLAQIEVGGGQVWGVNAFGDLYRHERGQWNVIGDGFINVSVGTTYN